MEEDKSQDTTNSNVGLTYTDPVTGKFVKGNPGGGRPKGSVSIKDRIRQHLEEHPEAVEDIVSHFVEKNRELMWQMLEGRPQQDVTTDGKALPAPLLYALPDNNSNQEDTQPEEAN